MQTESFDYIIIGAGAAGLQLAMAIEDDPFFSASKILLLDEIAKTTNDRTWSYWEEGRGKWDDLLWKSWGHGRFMAEDFDRQLDLSPYRYKTLRSIDFYRHCQDRLEKSSRLSWRQQKVVAVTAGVYPQVRTDVGAIYTATHVFDSRIPGEFTDGQHTYAKVLQHFKGWVIETDADCFNEREFLMMDFRQRWKDTCSFTYILPESPRKALVEFTFFSPELVKNEEYEAMLKQYIEHRLGMKNYSITETEFGVIPMTDFPFHHFHEEGVTKIGTAGGWVKGSTGYSFSNAGRMAARMLANIKAGRRPHHRLYSVRHALYDRLFLDILEKRNDTAPALFTEMYRKNPVIRIFRFLDNQSSVLDDLRIITSFNPIPFLKAIWRSSRSKRKYRKKQMAV